MSTPVVATVVARAQVVDTVVAAFAEDPAFRYFFDRAEFHQQSAIFAGYLFDRRVARSSVWVIDGGMAVSMWDSPGTEPTKSTLDLPASVLARIDAFGAAADTLMPSTPHWYLGVVATHPAHSGKRWGRLAIEAGLAKARESGLPAYLETAAPGNVDLYRRAGWELVGQPSNGPIPLWVMRTGVASGNGV